ncbi:hypothetical protein EDD60_105120 [Longibaculum muris]|uniref:Sigma-70-like protein n=1 Tax=Longibaculum muris TaxID=1796628 RepID=A0A4R3Z4N6_9FIRM|nr:hypothetical protein HMPREF3037_03019 [Candidatus Stoquefichus sp. KLE1796]TCW01016.1 hypothetical protein EDD60_105120 [Longibaculum muris]
MNIINKLPKNQSKRIIGYFYYDLSFAEITRIQGVYPKTV